MVSSSVSALLRLAGWSYIPDLATRQLLQFTHRFMKNPPPPRTPAFSKHYRIAFAAVVLGFLSYNLFEALRAMPPNYYEILSVQPDVGEAELKQAFKAFARKHHPDHGGPEDLFIEGRLALQTLKDPIKRFAYDRFGPDVESWSHCKTIRDYLRQGVLQSSGYHIVTGCGLIIWSSIQSSSVTFWRYLLFLIVLASELALVLNNASTMWTTLFPHRVPYQQILFLHQLFLFFSVALSKVAPVVFPTPVEENWDVAQFGQMLNLVNELSRLANKEVFGILHGQLRSIHPLDIPLRERAGIKFVDNPSEEVMEVLTSEMENMMIESRLKQNEGPVQSAWEAAIAKGKSRDFKQSNGLLSPVSVDKEPTQGRLPSPRLSPPTEILPFRWPRLPLSSGYMRGRSLSY